MDPVESKRNLTVYANNSEDYDEYERLTYEFGHSFNQEYNAECIVKSVDTTTPVVVDTTAPVVIDTTAPVDDDTTAPVVVDTTAPVDVGTTAPVVVDTTAPVVVDTMAPGVVENAALVVVKNEAPVIVEEQPMKMSSAYVIEKIQMKVFVKNGSFCSIEENKKSMNLSSKQLIERIIIDILSDNHSVKC
jgi:hypothetical protein